MRLFDYLDSGNGYKCRLLLRQLGIPFARVDVDIMTNETHTPEFLARNPNGKIPVLELADGRCIPESNAILCYLAEGTAFLAGDRYERALTLSWLFFEQYSHEPNIATTRFIVKHLPADSPRRSELPRRRELGYAALDVMEKQLRAADFFVANRYSIADIALYAYTHVAGEGGFDLERYSAVRSWFTRIESQPGYTPITEA
jgi:glutathione S-transferase